MKGGDEGVEEMDGVEWQRSVGGQEVVVLMLIRSWSLVYGYSLLVSGTLHPRLGPWFALVIAFDRDAIWITCYRHFCIL